MSIGCTLLILVLIVLVIYAVQQKKQVKEALFYGSNEAKPKPAKDWPRIGTNLEGAKVYTILSIISNVQDAGAK
ncbi:hypothetical protein M8C21_002609 [Ambrosia artemisiifolia]|uniref:Uncharacterized protein n=1 Tax=Ambrosia artemisiifolia TaxID=4212 RepID=A0AAD5D2I8_AMBAR|nr:hypothetical protein M8C21_002609 [Ambrosia artemisiifolia]